MKRRRRKSKERGKAAEAGKPVTASGQEYRVMTVALIREPREADAVEVAFSESARFYRLVRTHSEFERILTTLRDAKQKKLPLRVAVETPQSNVITNAQIVA